MNVPFNSEHTIFTKQCCHVITMQQYQMTYSGHSMFFNKILFGCLKEYHQISPETEVEHMLMLFTSDISLYDPLGVNIKSNRPLSSHFRQGHLTNIC